ncbi:MAG: DNA-binding protein [Promethearchaeota archaeon]
MSDESDELSIIRRRKLQAILKEKKQLEIAREAEEEQERKRQQLLQEIFMPDATAYLAELKQTKPHLATRIEDIALTLFLRRQLVRRIPKIGVLQVQRRLEGVEPKIMVKRRGEDAISFYESVRKDLEEQD